MDILLQQHLQSPLVLSALSTNMAMKQATLFGFLKPKVEESSIPIKEEMSVPVTAVAVPWTTTKMKATSVQSNASSPRSTPVKRKATDSADAARELEASSKRGRVFVPSWQKTYPWLVHDEEKDMMYCAVCREVESSHTTIKKSLRDLRTQTKSEQVTSH